MIERTRLAKSGLETSRLGFGTSRLHYIGGADRQRLLALAVDLGFTHFDTAPLYGDGLAEREIGALLRGRRDGIIVATKFGYPPDPLLDALPVLGGPIRPLRAIARRAGLWQMRPALLTAPGLRHSTEASLRRVGTDAIDILLLHDAVAARIPSVDDLLAEAGELKRRGLIRLFGLAGNWASLSGLAPALRAGADVIQTVEGEWPVSMPPDITYGALGGGPQSAFGAKPPAAAISSRLRAALARRPSGTLLVSTTNAEHLREIVRAAETARS